MKIAITGSIGVGKSEVFKILKKIKKNVKFIDSDEIVLSLYKKEQVLKDLFDLFKTSDKKEISEIVFSDENELKKLNSYMHIKVIEEIKKEMKDIYYDIFFVDVPLLYELNLEYLFDEVIVVYTNFDLQIERIMKRNNLSFEQANNRIKSQIDIEEKIKKSNYVIENIYDLERLYINTLDTLFRLEIERK